MQLDRLNFPPASHGLRSSDQQRGLTLIEVMVTLLVVSLGLMGIGIMFARGQQLADESYQRFAAVSIAHEFVERLSANAQQATALVQNGTNAYIKSDLGKVAYAASKNCGAADCTPAEIADYDLANFASSLRGAQKNTSSAAVAALINARGCVQALGNNTSTNPTRYLVSVVWQGRADAGTASETTESANCAKDDLTPATGRRVVSMEVQVIQ